MERSDGGAENRQFLIRLKKKIENALTYLDRSRGYYLFNGVEQTSKHGWEELERVIKLIEREVSK